MTPEDFVSQVRSTVVQQNVATYRDLFESMTPEGASDTYWKRALALHRSLSEADRAILLDIMRQVMVDAVSNLFGILDGASALEGPREDFTLTSRPDNLTLNGNLQDLFLAAEERERE